MSASKIVVLALSLLALGSLSAQEKATVTIEKILDTETAWDGSSYGSYPDGQPELSVLKITIPPNTALPWHTHPIPNAGYVVSGELTVERKDGERKVVKQGEVLPETVDSIHRGISGNRPVTLIVFYAGARGLPLSQLCGHCATPALAGQEDNGE
jgi:quercetin dioxygenase-like cupin family protein